LSESHDSIAGGPNANAGKGLVNLSSIIGLSPHGRWRQRWMFRPSVFNAVQSRNTQSCSLPRRFTRSTTKSSTARICQRFRANGQAIRWCTDRTPNPSTGNNFPSGGFPVINYEPTGLTLNFTPQVFPNLDVAGQDEDRIEGCDGANTLTPTFTERVITGTAARANNRTMMLASVNDGSAIEWTTGIPILGGLRFSDALHGAGPRKIGQVDIVISVTPRVLRAPAVTRAMKK